MTIVWVGMFTYATERPKTGASNKLYIRLPAGTLDICSNSSIICQGVIFVAHPSYIYSSMTVHGFDGLHACPLCRVTDDSLTDDPLPGPLLNWLFVHL